jgi:hypothetical protein
MMSPNPSVAIVNPQDGVGRVDSKRFGWARERNSSHVWVPRLPEGSCTALLLGASVQSSWLGALKILEAATIALPESLTWRESQRWRGTQGGKAAAGNGWPLAPSFGALAVP